MDGKEIINLLKNTLISRFLAGVSANQNAIALQFQNKLMTYSELDLTSNKLASLLLKKKIVSESPIVVLIERSIDMVIAIYAIEKAGACYVPIAPDNPFARTEYIIKDVGASCIITDQDIDFQGIEVFNISKLMTEYEMEPSVPVDRSKENSLAYIIYTSGSTGNPKGVAIEHKSIVNRLDWMQKSYPLTTEDVIIQKTPYTFDVSVWELFWGLQIGAKLYIANPGGHKDSEYLASVIEKEKISVIHFVPSMLNAFFKTDVSGCGSIKYLFSSGEELTGQIVNRFFEVFDEKTALINLYGPTEAAIDVTFWNCTKEDRNKKIPIGYPIDNTQIYILDECNNKVLDGIMGEIAIAGVQLARGYINREELTKKNFINICVHGKIDVRVYKTGDLGIKNPKGYIDYYGRIDQQVKIRGNRVEMGEIEATIKETSDIDEAVVVALDDHCGDKTLVAYIETKAGLTIDRIKGQLKNRLPEYMVPGRFVLVDEMPHLQNGKIDRKKLLDLISGEKLYSDDNQKLCNNEKIVMQIVSEELGVMAVPKNEELFGYGLDSIKIIRIVSRLRKAGFHISGEEIYSNAKISEIARGLVQGRYQSEKIKKFALLDEDDL